MRNNWEKCKCHNYVTNVTSPTELQKKQEAWK